MRGDSLISPELVARDAAGAAGELDGVARVVQGVGKGIRVGGDAIEIHSALSVGAALPGVGSAVRANVAGSLERLTDAPPRSLDVVVDEVDVSS